MSLTDLITTRLITNMVEAGLTREEIAALFGIEPMGELASELSIHIDAAEYLKQMCDQSPAVDPCGFRVHVPHADLFKYMK